MTIYLVRHTQYHNPDNIFPFHLPVYLSEEGRAHAGRIAQWFATHALMKLPVISSPMVRCVQTAEIIAAQTQSFVSIDERLAETASPGIQGKVQPSENAWQAEQLDPHRETQASVRERANALFEERKQIGEDCILVSHGDPLTLLYFHLQGEQVPEDLWNPIHDEKVVHRGEIVKIEIKHETKPELTRYNV